MDFGSISDQHGNFSLAIVYDEGRYEIVKPVDVCCVSYDGILQQTSEKEIIFGRNAKKPHFYVSTDSPDIRSVDELGRLINEGVSTAARSKRQLAVKDLRAHLQGDPRLKVSEVITDPNNIRVVLVSKSEVVPLGNLLRA